MKKRLNTLNEEMDRIKSLFGNDRLYGNLIAEQVEKLSEDKCKVKINGIYDLKMSTKKMTNYTPSEQDKNEVEYCLKTYPKTFLVNNPIKKIDDKSKKVAEILGINTSNISVDTNKVKGEKESDWIEVVGRYKNVIADIKPLGNNLFSFKSRKGNQLISLSNKNTFKSDVLEYIKQALPKEYQNNPRIVLMKAKNRKIRKDRGIFTVIQNN